MSSNTGAAVTQTNETLIKSKCYVFTWIVKNFNFDLPFRPGDYIDSPCFKTDYASHNLQLYNLGGFKYNNKDTVYIRIPGRVSPMKIAYSAISLVNKIGEEDFRNVKIIDIPNTNIYELAKISNITSDFLPNGHLTIKWKLNFYIGKESSESSPIQSIENLAEKHRLVEFDDFEKLMKDNRFSDIKVVVDTQTFYAHKNILAARSRYFAAMFESDMKEMKEGKIRIVNISANIMQEMLRFIYTGKINKEQTTITDLLIAADMYGLDGLITICGEALMSTMSLENIGSILTVIDHLSNVPKLKDSAIEFLMKNRKELSGNESFRKALNSLSPSFLVEVINIIMSKF